MLAHRDLELPEEQREWRHINIPAVAEEGTLDSLEREPGQYLESARERTPADWERIKGKSRLTWAEAKASTRAAWHRVETALPGDFDGDGR